MTKIRLFTTSNFMEEGLEIRRKDIVAEFESTVYIHRDGATIDIYLPSDLVKTLRGK